MWHAGGMDGYDTLNVVIEPALKEQVRAAAKRERRSMSSFACHLFEQYLNARSADATDAPGSITG